MKKIYFFLSAACVAATASAVQKEMTVNPKMPVKAETVKAVKSEAGIPKAIAKVNPEASGISKTRAEETANVSFRPADNVMAIGSNVLGNGYRGLGFASSYGNVDFYNYSSGVSAYEWNFSVLNDYEVVDNSPVWNVQTSDTPDLSIKSGIGFFQAPVLYGTSEATGEKILDEGCFAAVYCGGGADYWGINSDAEEDDEVVGLTYYQNHGLADGKATGFTTRQNTYYPNGTDYDANGVYSGAKNSWKTYLEAAWFRGSTVSDITFNNYTIIQPKPMSTYMMSRGWIWMDVQATGATQLVSNIYPIDEEGEIGEMPIATGYAAIPAGGTDTPVFYYVPLNEEGDEIEDVVYIDSAVAITIEGFVGNDQITSVSPVSGFYPFSYSAYAAGNYDVMKVEDFYISMNVTADDNKYNNVLVYNLGLYGFGDDPDTATGLCYTQFNVDATFPYIHSVDGVEKVTIPLEGGMVETEIDALYYNIQKGVEEGWYVLEAPEWLTVEVSEPNPETGTTVLSISAAAGENRTGVVSIEGFGVIYSLTVNQGEGAAVSTVAIEKGAQYFDLQGRRVANPDKGIYIKKSGNKTEKVIL